MLQSLIQEMLLMTYFTFEISDTSRNECRKAILFNDKKSFIV